MPYEAIKVEGLRELNRAFGQLDKELAKELRSELKKAGEPVRTRAEALAGSEIRNIGATWRGMKVGATLKTVYVAPRARRKGGSPRPNLGGLLMRKALIPALEKSTDEVVRGVERVLDTVITKAGF